MIINFISQYFFIHQLIHPTDSKGQICGGNGILKDRPYLLYEDITECLNPAVITLGCPTPQICVKECPEKTSIEEEYTKLFCSSDGLQCPKYVLKSKDVSHFTFLTLIFQIDVTNVGFFLFHTFLFTNGKSTFFSNSWDIYKYKNII